jgi:tRNA(Arg) A34 adenosine deaminase TadA
MENKSDLHYADLAISWSRESVKQGRFPAGAVLVLDYHQKPVAYCGISGNGADFRHAEVRAINEVLAVNDAGLDLHQAVLYASMEPCIMCLSTAYWAGIRKIVYVIRRSKVDLSYYESNIIATSDLKKALNRDIEFAHAAELEEKALEVVYEWERGLRSTTSQ